MAWVSVAAAIVAVLDLVCMALILKYWATAEQFGTVSIVLTMFGALQLAGEAGLPAAIVQRENTGDDRLSTAYWLGLITGTALFGALWLLAPVIAGLYELPALVDIFRMAGLLLVIRPLYTTHQGILRRELRFRELSIIRIGANLTESVIKLATALGGGGVLAFVFGPLARELVYAIAVPASLRWRPRFTLKPSLVRDDYRFGLRASGGELLYQFYSNLDYQVVAHAFGPAALGIYRAAYELVVEPVRFASGVVTVVAFPAFSRLRTDSKSLTDQFMAFARQNLGFALVIVGAVVVAAPELLELTVGPEYVVATNAARILAVVAVFRALSHLGPPLLDGVGRPDLTLRYQVTATLVVSSSFLIAGAVGTSFLAVAVAWAISYPIAFAILWTMIRTQLGVTTAEFVRHIALVVASIGIATALGAVVHMLATDLDPLLRLIASAGTVGLGSLALRRLMK